MSSDRSGLLITLPAKPENVSLVRHAVADLGEQLGLGARGIGDLKTVVTEACMNAALHAYGTRIGLLQVEALPEDGGIAVCIRDFGTGMRPRIDAGRASLHLGLPLIAALSSRFKISSGAWCGTEIKVFISGHRGDEPVSATPVSG